MLRGETDARARPPAARGSAAGDIQSADRRRARRRRARGAWRSPLTRRILALNVLVLAVPVFGLLHLEQYRDSLIEAELEALNTQARAFATTLAGSSVVVTQSGEEKLLAEGTRHAMAGLLGVETSFAAPRLHLGYRTIQTRVATPLGPAGARFTGHEFHYAATLHESGTPFAHAGDSSGRDLGDTGLVAGTVAGSFLHLIDRA